MQNINYDDALVSDVVTITIKGKSYEVQEPSLGAILRFERESAKLTSIEEIKDIAAQIVKIIKTVYVDIPTKAFDGLSPKLLYKILFDIKQIVQDSMLPEFVDIDKKQDSAESPKKKLTTKG